jgi:hypothetical protein
LTGTLCFPDGPSLPRHFVVPTCTQLAALWQVPAKRSVSTKVSSSTGLILYCFCQSRGICLAAMARISEARLFTWTHGKMRHRRISKRIDIIHYSFAVNALWQCCIRGQDVQAMLPILSTYLGHVSIASTLHYLSFVEEIRTETSERFHQRFGRLLFTRIPIPKNFKDI